MIISHKYKYVFVELPHTGTTAISAELREFYDGSKILRKHARYSEFLRTASAAEREYFAFSCIRNPLDVAVSLYFRYKTDHHSRYSKPHGSVTRSEVELYRFIQRTGADFSTFFTHEYRRPIPYDNFSREAHRLLNFVMRFEHLQDDFAVVLGLIGIEPRRSLPMVNSTSGRRDDLRRTIRRRLFHERDGSLDLSWSAGDTTCLPTGEAYPPPYRLASRFG